MRISIKNLNYDIVEFNQIQINGKKAVGGYGFIIALTGNLKGIKESCSIFDLKLSAFLKDSQKAIFHCISAHTQLIQCNQYGNSNEQIFFELILTREQVNAIEDARQAKNMDFTISLDALVNFNNSLIASKDRTELTIPREQWLDALRNSGFRETIIFEIPLPQNLGELKNLILKAQEFIEIGHYKDAVLQCRLIIESVEIFRADQKDSRDANKKAHSPERKNMNSTERLLSLREQLKNICQLGAHVNDQEEFTRLQANAILGTTLALLSEPTIGFSPSNNVLTDEKS